MSFASMAFPKFFKKDLSFRSISRSVWYLRSKHVEYTLEAMLADLDDEANLTIGVADPFWGAIGDVKTRLNGVSMSVAI